MKNSSYAKGTLLWIDDNFARDDFRHGADINVWARTFGDADYHIFRLLDLQLDTAVCYDEAIQAIDYYLEPTQADNLLIAVVDLHLPSSRSNLSQTRIKNGIMIAEHLRRNEVPFYFLSSKAESIEDLKTHGLETIPYFQKYKEEGGSHSRMMMPSPLIRAILAEFRNSISWINLSALQDNASPDSQLFHTDVASHRDSRNFFPFFSAFGDFVERWEHRPLNDTQQYVILRAPVTHSDTFVMQCALVITADLLHRHPQKITLRFLSGDVAEEVDKLERAGRLRDKGHVTILRPRHSEAPPLYIDKLFRIRQAGLTILVVANDETAEQIVDRIPPSSRVMFDDLPYVRPGDGAAREQLIRRCCEHVFQRCKVVDDEGRESPLHPLYIAHPEIAIHPVHWVALMENRDIEKELTDPWEILNALHQATEWDPADDADAITRLIEGQPIPTAKLLKVAEKFIKNDHAMWQAWVERALDLWLRLSWKFPYGLDERIGFGEAVPSYHEETWEDHSLNVIMELCDKYHPLPAAGEIDPRSINSNLPKADTFLDHPAIRCLINEPDQFTPHDAEALETLRWPHLRYPMPMALNRKLGRVGHHLWAQSEHMELASLFRPTRHTLLTLNVLLEAYAERLEWLESVAPALPEGWRQIVEELTPLIRSGEMTLAWQDRERRNRLWHLLLGILRNGLPVSVISRSVALNHPLARKRRGRQSEPLAHLLPQIKQYGTLLNRLRELRSESGGTGPALLDGAHKRLCIAFKGFTQYGALARNLGNGDSDQGKGRLQEFLGTSVRFFEQLLELPGIGDPCDAARGCRNCERNFNQLVQEVAERAGFQGHENWFPGDARLHKLASDSFPPSLLGHKQDYLWHALDALERFRYATLHHRHFDGYHLLAVLNDLRIQGKDTAPRVGDAAIEGVTELFVWGFEGLVTQLRYCLEAAGATERAAALEPATVRFLAPDTLPAAAGDIERVFRIRENGERGYEVFTLGIPGAGIVNHFAYHKGSEVILLDP